MSTLSREQVESIAGHIANGHVTGFLNQLIDHIETQRDVLRQREEEIAKRMTAWNKLRDGYDESIAQLQAQLATVTQERDALRKAQKNLAGQYNSLSQQLAAAQARCVQLENVLRSILHADERGQGLPFSQAMDRADKLLTPTEGTPT